MSYILLMKCESSKFDINKFIKKRRRKRRLFIFLICFVSITVLLITYILRILNPIIISITEAKVQSLTTRSVNNAVTEVLFENNISYSDLIDIRLNNAGEIAMIEANAVKINRLARSFVNTSQAKMDVIGEQGVNIPVGSLTGIAVFMGQGPEVRIKIYPIGAITCSFTSEFSQAGINQTNHKIYVNITSTVNVVLPIDNKQIINTSQILICESVIVGKVPQVYLNGGSNLLQLGP